MSIKINPYKLKGVWQDGYALDLHTISSTFLGHDSFGHAVFDTTRSEIGELLYRVKYGHDRTTIDAIAEVVAGFLGRWQARCDLIVPVPPSNISRSVQPVIEIARKVSDITGMPLQENCVTKLRSTGELKDVFELEKRAAALKGAFAVDPSISKGKRVLLFDDLYRSGATVTEIARLLQTDGGASAVYLLALTRTRSKS